jgi:hypothetical protein
VNDFDKLQQTNASLQQLNAALEQNNGRLQQTVATLCAEVEGYRQLDGYGSLVLQVKYDELTGKVPFVPLFSSWPTRLYSEQRVVRGYKVRLFVVTKETSPEYQDHHGLYLRVEGGPYPCKVQHTYELVHHDGLAASAIKITGESTYAVANKSFGYSRFIPKARLASPDNNPYVEDGYVTFKCAFKILDGCA